MQNVNQEKIKAAFQLLSIHDTNDKEIDATAKFTPGLNWVPQDEPIGNDAKILFANFEYPGILMELKNNVKLFPEMGLLIMIKIMIHIFSEMGRKEIMK